MVTSYFPSASSTIFPTLCTYGPLSPQLVRTGAQHRLWCFLLGQQAAHRGQAATQSRGDVCARHTLLEMHLAHDRLLCHAHARRVAGRWHGLPVGRPERAQDAPRPCKHLANATQLWNPRQLMEIISQAAHAGVRTDPPRHDTYRPLVRGPPTRSTPHPELQCWRVFRFADLRNCFHQGAMRPVGAPVCSPHQH